MPHRSIERIDPTTRPGLLTMLRRRQKELEELLPSQSELADRLKAQGAESTKAVLKLVTGQGIRSEDQLKSMGIGRNIDLMA